MSVSTEHWKKITRGCAEIISESELKAKLEKPHPLRIKLGVDPTAPDLHLGHLVVLRKLRTFQDLGHQVEFIIGDFTARIGDPSGQSSTRPTLKPQEIWEHAKTYQDQVFRVLKKEATQVRFNSSWINALGIPGFLELARRASVAQMLERADFKERFEKQSNISLLEFYYPLLQGYDSVAVQADVELGGTDQKFNLLMGRETQREYKQEPQVVMTMPLLEGLDGVKKMSKSYGNYIAFNDTSKEMFGKIMSLPDRLTSKYAELLTDIDLPLLNNMHPKTAKVLLAKTLTAQFYGNEIAEKEALNFDRLFSQHEVPEDIEEKRIPFYSDQPWPIAKLLVELYAMSNGEARRLVDQGAVEFKDLSGEWKRCTLDFKVPLVPGENYIIRVGKKRLARVIPLKQNVPNVLNAQALKILLSGVNLDFQKVVESSLKKLENKVLERSEAETTLELARNKKADLIILDLDMHPRSGLDLLKQLRRLPDTQNIPMILLSERKTKNIDVGEGLGLFLVKRIIKRNVVKELFAAVRELTSSNR